MTKLPDSRMTVTFDGHDITARYMVTGIDRPRSSYALTTEDNPAGGAFFLGSRAQAGSVTMDVHIDGPSRDRRDAIRELASWLAVDGPRELAFSDDEGLCYMAVPDGMPDLERFYFKDLVTLSFTIPEPYMLGAIRKATVPSGGTASVIVGGTAPALPLFSASAAVRDGSTGVWGLRLDDGDYIRVPIGTASAAPVEIDCTERTAKANGAIVLPTLDSDWLAFEPGTHSVENDEGTGACAVEYRERWRI